MDAYVIMLTSLTTDTLYWRHASANRISNRWLHWRLKAILPTNVKTKKKYVEDADVYSAQCGWMVYICINKLDQCWFQWWLVACWVPSKYLTQWWLILSWTIGNNFSKAGFGIQQALTLRQFCPNRDMLTYYVQLILFAHQFTLFHCSKPMPYCWLS